MKRTLFALIVLCVAAVPTLAKDDEAAFKALIDKYCSAWGSLDPDKAAPLYAKEADLVFYDITPLKYTGWTEYDKGVRPHFALFESLKLTPKGDLKVSQHGNLAWTTTTMQIELKEKSGEPMSMDVRQTLVLEKRGGAWLIVHEHLSAPLHMHE
jgi:uncharacterized protein (TIGR02246 family)